MPIEYNELDGDLIVLAKQGKFEVIAHGCNCFCTMGAGIAPQMAKAFSCDQYSLEMPSEKGKIDKLGRICYATKYVKDGHAITENFKELDPIGRGYKKISVVNAYTQYKYGRNHPDGDVAPFDYDAFTLCMKKINHIFKGKHLGIPKIGSHLAGGDWEVIKGIIHKTLTDMKVTVVNFKP